MSNLHEVIARFEHDIDRIHESNPIMQVPAKTVITDISMHAEDLVRKTMAHLPNDLRSSGKLLEILTHVVAGYDQCIDWIFSPSPNVSQKDYTVVTPPDLTQFLELGFLYTHLSSLFISWHRGFATNVQVSEHDKYIQFTIPSFFLQYHASAMQSHQVEIPMQLTDSLSSARAQLLKIFEENPSAVLPAEEWNHAFELVYEVISADWPTKWEDDLGGFTMEQARRVAAALRLWSELWLFGGVGLPVVSPKVLFNLIHRYSGVELSAVKALVSDMTFSDDRIQKGLSSSAFPFLELPETPYITWSPVKVFLMNSQRELMRRLAKMRPQVHDLLSDAKHEALLNRVLDSLQSYSRRIMTVANINLENTDIDLLLIDKENATYVFVELKAVMTPRTLREALDIDARRSNKGKLIDGLLKGVEVQIPHALKFARENPLAFVNKVQSKSADQSVPFPKMLWGCVVSPWTFGTGAADIVSDSNDRVRLLNVPILERELANVNGDLNQLWLKLERNSHLIEPKTLSGEVRYGGYTVSWRPT